MKNKIKAKRAEIEMSQEELARKVGISRTSLVNIEKGKQIPSVQTSKRISDALESSIEEVFFNET